MSRVLITGSADGIGLASAQLLAERGHRVFLHARNADRAAAARSAVPAAADVLVGDLSTVAGAKQLAAAACAAGPFDAVVHNAGLGPSAPAQRTADGLAATFAVNTLAPYILTSLIRPAPPRLLYLSSSMAAGGSVASFDDIAWSARPWDPYQAYQDSKLQDILLANAVARAWPRVQSCSLDPGWIRTKMGGAGAPGVVATPAAAIADFAAGDGPIVGRESGVYFNPHGVVAAPKDAADVAVQDALMKICKELSGVDLPEG